MHLSIQYFDDLYHVWSEVEPQMYMQIASFHFKDDAELFIEARNTPIDLGQADLVADDLAADSMEGVLLKFLRAQ